MSPNVKKLIARLVSDTPDEVETELVEIKSWCHDKNEFAEKAAEAAMCLANTRGGTVILGVKEGARCGFSPSPYPEIDCDWLSARIQALSVPPVTCTVDDISSAVTDYARIGCNAYAITVPKSTRISGHRSTKGISKIRVGKQCNPVYTTIEDDFSACVVPGSSVTDLCEKSVEIGREGYRRKFGVAVDREELLAKAGLLADGTGELTLAALLLFGSESALQRRLPANEVLVLTPFGEERWHTNIVSSVERLCGGRSRVVACCPKLDSLAHREAVVNALIHRCYRTPAPVKVTVEKQTLQIRSPGPLLGLLSAESLLQCVPTYRNFLLADAARYVGLCDKIGQGIKLIYRAVLSGGFNLPIFEGASDSFGITIRLAEDVEFRRFVETRSESLDALEYLVVLNVLWSRDSAPAGVLQKAMQLGEGRARRVLDEMVRKLMIQQDGGDASFRLSEAVQHDRRAISGDQLPLGFSPTGSAMPTVIVPRRLG